LPTAVGPGFKRLREWLAVKWAIGKYPDMSMYGTIAITRMLIPLDIIMLWYRFTVDRGVVRISKYSDRDIGNKPPQIILEQAAQSNQLPNFRF
jgi:hypothetical protein